MFARIAQFARSRGLDRERGVAFLRFTWQRFLDESCLQAAGALSLTSIFATVPLVAAVLGILAAFPGFAGWREQLTDFVFANFVPAAGSALQGYITQFAANASKTTAIGILVLLFSAILLMMSIEDAFNRIWRVKVARTAVSRFVVYWAALTLGPLLLVAALAVSSYLLALPFIDAAEAQFSIKARVLSLLPFLIVWVALLAGYVVIPNRSVRLRDAVIGALIAALLFEAAKRGFAFYVTSFPSYQRIYGALAAVPIFVLWIYLSWIIVLLGASISASLSAFDFRPTRLRLPEGQEFVGLLPLLARFAAAQREGRGLGDRQLLADEPWLTDELLQRYLGDLTSAHIIQRTEIGEWVLARDLATTTLAQIYEEGGYRIPLTPTIPLGAAQQDQLHLFTQIGALLRRELDAPLDEIFPLPARSQVTTDPASPDNIHLSEHP